MSVSFIVRLDPPLKGRDCGGLPFSIIPIGTGESLGNAVASVLRLVSNISIDLRPSKPDDRLTEKIKSIEKRLGKKLKT